MRLTNTLALCICVFCRCKQCSNGICVNKYGLVLRWTYCVGKYLSQPNTDSSSFNFKRFSLAHTVFFVFRQFAVLSNLYSLLAIVLTSIVCIRCLFGCSQDILFCPKKKELEEIRNKTIHSIESFTISIESQTEFMCSWIILKHDFHIQNHI